MSSPIKILLWNVVGDGREWIISHDETSKERDRTVATEKEKKVVDNKKE